MQTTLPELPASDPDKELAPGQKVGEYVIEGKLGAGGFGTVFRASHPVIGKLVAIKVLNRQFSVQREMVSRFVAEARAVNQIRHRNIIDIFGFGTLEDGRHYYVMELLDGITLSEHLERKGKLGLGEALPILRAIGKALDAAHAKGIAHRDLKPENVFLAVDPDGGFFPKLLDFGIAKLLLAEDDDPSKSANHKTRTGAPIGTPLYMSPEQCRGRDVDHRTDIYAFGIVAFRMLTGRLPFDADDYMTILMRQMSDEPPLPSSVSGELPSSVDRAILWMLAKEPSARPASLMKAVEAIEHAAAEIGVASPTWNATPPPEALGAAGKSDGPATHSATLPASSLRGEGGRELGRGVAIGTAATLDSSQMTVPAISGARHTTPDVAAPAHAVAHAAKQRRTWIWIAAAAVIAAAVAYTIILPHDDGAPPPPAAPSATAPPSAPPPLTAAPPAKVRLTFTGLPDGAVVFDASHTALGLAKQGIEVPRSAQPLALTFEVGGQVVNRHQLVPEADATIAITVTPSETAEGAAPAEGKGEAKTDGRGDAKAETKSETKAETKSERPRRTKKPPGTPSSPSSPDPNSTERPPGL